MPTFTNSGDRTATAADDTFIYDLPRPVSTTIDAAGGSDTLIVHFDPATGPVKFDLSDDGASGSWNADIRVNPTIPLYVLNFEHAELYGSDSNDSFRLQIHDTSSDLTVTMDGGGGEDLLRFVWSTMTTGISFVVDGSNVTSSFGTFFNFEVYYIFAGSGDDTVVTGAGSDSVVTGTGVDHVSTGAGNDSVYAQSSGGSIDLGDGDDYLELTLTSGFSPFETIDGGNGIDRLFISWEAVSTGQSFVLEGSTLTSSLGAMAGFETFYITAGSGDDTIKTGSAGDYVYAGAGNDDVSVGAGNDTAYAGAGDDQVDAGSGNDAIYGGLGNDIILGSDGADSLYGDEHEFSSSGDGNDQIDGGSGSDTIYGGGGNDLIAGGTENDFLVGGKGADHLDGGDGNDWLIGFGETAYGEIDDYQGDLLVGGAGDDHFVAGFGDNVDGGFGTDWLDYNAYGASSGISANFSLLTNGETINVGGGTLSGIEYVTRIGGSDFADNITAGASPGVDGPSIDGFGGSDHLTGGAANDLISGGDGDDVIVGGSGDDRLRGDAGNDRLSGGGGVDTLVGGSGSDIFADTAAGLNGDNLSDFSAEDKIVITDATLNGFAFSVSGNTLTYSGGSITFGSAVSGEFQAKTAEGGGVEISVYLPPVGTVDQIANQLSTGYWNGAAHHFDVSQNRVITVNLSALNDTERGLARAALMQWSDIIGVHFEEVGLRGQIVFDNTEVAGGPVAETDANWANGIISSAVVHISTSWIVENGSSLDSYSFQTYLHEIGHALGLGHAGNYNTTAEYPNDASFLNDSWVLSVMSYFDQHDSSFFAQRGFSIASVVSPMLADIIAVQSLYGLSTTARTGDTVYGYNSNAGAVFDATAHPSVAYTIVDNGGTDTLDFSGSGSSQLIDLRPETFSSVNGLVGNLVISRGTIIENAIGGISRDTLIGNDAANVLDGRGGGDTMTGGLGDDVYVVDNVGDVVIEELGEGADSVAASITYVLAANVENLTLEGLFHIDGTGNTLANIITGNGGNNVLTGLAGDDILRGGLGNDTLDGGVGVDKMYGGVGDDTYIVSDATDYTYEYAGEGTDLVLASVTTRLRDFVENLTLTGSGNIYGTGNDLANVITGNAGSNRLYGLDGDDTLYGLAGNDTLDAGSGNDYLDGGAGADQMSGGLGNDIFIVDNVGDVATEAAGQGTDEVRSSVGYTLGANLENLLLTGSAGINGTGNTLANIITGNGGNNVLTGLAGDDILRGGLGNDTLDGGVGVDKMYGGVGDDTYIVSDATDYTYEYAGEGTDLVLASVTTRLRDFVENLTLTGSGNIYGTGNDLANVITGNAGSNRLYGLDGDDTLYGLAGNDTLYGGVGTDHLYGGIGNDVYSVGDAGDIVHENGGEGTDTVYSFITYTLTANVERLYLVGSEAIDATGNSGANILKGNEADNVLSGGDGNDLLYGYGGNDTLVGGAGVDKMYGREGDDTYIVSDSTDFAYEAAGQGTDTVLASVTCVLRDHVEVLTLTGTDAINGYGNGQANILTGNDAANLLAARAGDDQLSGLGGDDILYGEDGNDLIAGGAGRDRAYGGSGSDTFIFADGDFGGADAATADIIHDFSQSEGDHIDLSAVDANTGLGGNQAFSFIGSAAFSNVAGQLRTGQIGANTYIMGDTDGDGTADFWIRLDGLHTLSGGDFIL